MRSSDNPVLVDESSAAHPLGVSNSLVTLLPGVEHLPGGGYAEQGGGGELARRGVHTSDNISQPTAQSTRPCANILFS